MSKGEFHKFKYLPWELRYKIAVSHVLTDNLFEANEKIVNLKLSGRVAAEDFNVKAVIDFTTRNNTLKSVIRDLRDMVIPPTGLDSVPLVAYGGIHCQLYLANHIVGRQPEDENLDLVEKIFSCPQEKLASHVHGCASIVGSLDDASRNAFIQNTIEKYEASTGKGEMAERSRYYATLLEIDKTGKIFKNNSIEHLDPSHDIIKYINVHSLYSPDINKAALETITRQHESKDFENGACLIDSQKSTTANIENLKSKLKDLKARHFDSSLRRTHALLSNEDRMTSMTARRNEVLSMVHAAGLLYARAKDEFEQSAFRDIKQITNSERAPTARLVDGKANEQAGHKGDPRRAALRSREEDVHER